MKNLSIYIYDSTQIRAKRDMTGKIYSIPQNAKLSTLFNNMFCHRLDLDCGVRQFKYQKPFFLLLHTMGKMCVSCLIWYILLFAEMKDSEITKSY